MAEKKENVITHTMHSGLVLGVLLIVRDFMVQDVFYNNLFAILILNFAGFVAFVSQPLTLPFVTIILEKKKSHKRDLKG